MIHPNKNDAATVVIKAYDKEGKEVEMSHIHGNYSPELQYLEFADRTRRELKAVRIVMDVLYAVIVCIFLSSGAEASIKGDCNGFNCNPFVGYSIDVVLEREFPEEKVEAIPYAEINISHYLDGWHDAFLWQFAKPELKGHASDEPIDDWVQLLIAAILILGMLTAAGYALRALREDENLRRHDNG